MTWEWGDEEPMKDSTEEVDAFVASTEEQLGRELTVDERLQCEELYLAARGDTKHQEMPIVNLCYCTCGGREAIRRMKEDPTLENVGRTLIYCTCCDRGECPAHQEDK